MKKNVMKLIGFVFVIISTSMMFSCIGKSKDSSCCENMPSFEKKLPQKSVWVHHYDNDSTEITFSSMEEAEWKLLHVVPNWSYEDFEKILLSDPSSMDYSFDSLYCDDKTHHDVFSPVTSEDGNMRCFGLYPHSVHEMPMMLAYCRTKGKVYKAEELGRPEDCYYCLLPDTIYTFKTGHSTLYFVWGYNGYTGSGNSYRLCAYELDSTGLHPAFVFVEKGGFSGWKEDGQSLYTEICMNDEMYDTFAEDNFRTLGYFDKNDSAVYIRSYIDKEMDEFSCSTQITNHYRKFVWDGNMFVREK